MEPPAVLSTISPKTVEDPDYSTVDTTPYGLHVPSSNGVAGRNDIDYIHTQLKLIDVGTGGTGAGASSHLGDGSARLAMVLFAIHCGDIGSSLNTSYTDYFSHEVIPGSTTDTGIPAGGKLWHQDIVKLILKTHNTIRQYCMYFAPMVWNFYLANRPPANWAKKGFTDTTKYAAFDFFSGVEHESSISIKLIRAPNPWERTAAQTAFAVYVARSAARASGYSSNAVEISRGQYLASGTRLALPAPPTSALN